MAEETNTNIPYFSNPADYQYAIIDPDSKAQFNELNKDLVTSNLTQAEIDYLNLAETVIGYCKMIGMVFPADAHIRDMMTTVNVAKSRRGFFIKQMTQTSIVKTEKFDSKKKQRSEY